MYLNNVTLKPDKYPTTEKYPFNLDIFHRTEGLDFTTPVTFFTLMTQSHGQSLMSYFKARYRIRGIYFLDEPETALSPKSQVMLLDVFEEMSRAGHAQFIVATHSPILLACSGAKIFSFDSSPISTIEYEDTAHYQVYRDFLEGVKQK